VPFQPQTSFDRQFAGSNPPQLAGGHLDLGFVSRQDKYDAYGGAELFCQPSVMESFSIVIMESWLCGTPVLVNAHCPVTVEHCQNSQGGLFFKDYLEFEGCLLEMKNHPEMTRDLARNGREYVLSHFHWDLISERYIQLIHQSWQDLEEGPRDSGQKEKSMKAGEESLTSPFTRCFPISAMATPSATMSWGSKKY